MRDIERILQLGGELVFDRLTLRTTDDERYAIVTKSLSGLPDEELFDTLGDALKEFRVSSEKLAHRLGII